MAEVKRLAIKLEDNANDMSFDIKELKSRLHEIYMDTAFLLIDYAVNSKDAEKINADFSEHFMNKDDFKDLQKLEEIKNLIEDYFE